MAEDMARKNDVEGVVELFDDSSSTSSSRRSCRPRSNGYENWKPPGKKKQVRIVTPFGSDGATDMHRKSRENEDISSGEEMWEEWWEDEDMYSRLGDTIDLTAMAEADLAEQGMLGLEDGMEGGDDF